MNWLKSIIAPVFKFFAKIFSKESANIMIGFFDKYGPLVNKAYPIVKKIAAMTVNKYDDALIAAYEHFSLKDLFDPTKDRKVLLRDLAKAVIASQVKEPIDDYILNTAVELAYARFKEETKVLAAQAEAAVAPTN